MNASRYDPLAGLSRARVANMRLFTDATNNQAFRGAASRTRMLGSIQRNFSPASQTESAESAHTVPANIKVVEVPNVATEYPIAG